MEFIIECTARKGIKYFYRLIRRKLYHKSALNNFIHETNKFFLTEDYKIVTLCNYNLQVNFSNMIYCNISQFIKIRYVIFM